LLLRTSAAAPVVVLPSTKPRLISGTRLPWSDLHPAEGPMALRRRLSSTLPFREAFGGNRVHQRTRSRCPDRSSMIGRNELRIKRRLERNLRRIPKPLLYRGLRPPTLCGEFWWGSPLKVGVRCYQMPIMAPIRALSGGPLGHDTLLARAFLRQLLCRRPRFPRCCAQRNSAAPIADQLADMNERFAAVRVELLATVEEV
jgi:hypothetical protein